MKAFFRPFASVWYVCAKATSFFFFGLGGLILGLLIFPTLSTFVHPRKRYRKAMRGAVSFSFRFFINLMRFFGIIRLKFGDLKQFKKNSGKIIISNHPSLLDVVFLIAYTPSADCIVKSKLWTNPFVRLIVSTLYIPNSLQFDDLLAACKSSLNEGNNIIIFPQGTRISEQTIPGLKRGCAQIALRSGADIVPLLFKVDDTSGLRKGDSFFMAPKNFCMHFFVELQETLKMETFDKQELSLAARTLTHEMELIIIPQQKQ